MLKLSKLTDYAIVVLSRLSDDAQRRRSAADLARDTGLAETTVAKVLKTLARGGLVQASRGPAGGYALCRPLTRISVAQVIVAFDGPIALTACVPAAPESCSVEQICPMRGGWSRVNTVIEQALDSVSVADMLSPASLLTEPPTLAVAAE